MALGLRELGVLVCCAALALMTLQQEGDLQMQPAWFQPLEQHTDSGMHGTVDSGSEVQLMSTFVNGVAPMENELVPMPLVTDIDGDGLNEVILVTREPKLKIFRFKGGGSQSQQSFHALYSHKGVDWDQLELVREVGLLSSLSITSGRQIVGLSSGYIRPYSRTRNRKQVIVLVNEGWGILVFNHKLRLMWTRAIEVDLSLRYLAEVAILVDPHPMRKGTATRNDTGVIVVGGRLALKSALRATRVGVHSDHTSGASAPVGPSPLEFPTDYAEALRGRILRPGSTPGTVTSDDEPDAHVHTEQLGTDPTHFEHESHFSYYAFEGLSGDTRWRHDSGSFLEETHGSDIRRPQHETMHSGEMDWREFRKSVLRYALPHSWEGGRAATRMELAHVEKTRRGARRQSVQSAPPIKSNFFVRDSPLGLRPHSDAEHIPNPNAIVTHLRDGVEILHLYSGRPLCRLTLKAGEVHVDMDGDGVVDHVEAVGGIHRSPASTGLPRGHGHSSAMPKCMAVVRSGIPPTRQLFNASICKQSWADLMRGGLMLREKSTSHARSSAAPPSDDHSAADHGVGLAGSAHTGRGGKSFSLEGSEGSTDGSGSGGSGGRRRMPSVAELLGAAAGMAGMSQNVEVAHPIVIQEPQTAGKSSKHRRFHSFFFLNNGLVSSFNHDGSRTWHTQTRASWMHSSGGMAASHATADAAPTPAAAPSLAALSFKPSLTPFPLRVDTPAEHVLVVGERFASLLSLGGSLRAEVALGPDLAVAGAMVADFDQDGVSDFIVVTTKGYYGYTVSRRLGGALFSLVVLALLLLLLAVFAFKLAQGDTFNLRAAKMRAGMMPQRSKTTFTGGLRAVTKSAKAQL